MALSREQKKRVLDGYGERLARGQVLVWAKYGGLTVEQFQRLRGALRATGCEAVVIKNTLMRIALERAGLSVDTESLVGPLVVSFIYGEIAPSTKALLDFAREFPEQLQVVGGLIGGKLANAPQVTSLATLPSLLQYAVRTDFE